MNANEAYNSAGDQTHAELGGMKFNSSLLKPPADVTDFEGSYEERSLSSRRSVSTRKDAVQSFPTVGLKLNSKS